MNNWKYKLVISDEITIETPIKAEATISWGINQQGQAAQFTLHNLSTTHRAQIRFNPSLISLNPKLALAPASKIEFYVSSDGKSYTKIFVGVILEAYSMQIGGQVGCTTYITAKAVDAWWAHSSHIFAKGTSKRDAIKVLLKDMPNVTLGNLGSIDGNFLTDTTCDGNTFEQIQKITGANCFIDNGVISIIPPNEAIEGTMTTLSQDTYLLGTPQIKSSYLTFKCLFIPELRFQQLLNVNSRVYSDFSGSYKVVGFTHTLVFSETESGNKTTDVCCVLIDDMAGQDVVTTMGTNKTDADTYNTTISNQTKNKVNGEKVTTINAEVSGDISRVKKYLQSHNGEIPNAQITSNISWKEMLGFHRNTKSDLANIPLDRLANCVKIAQKLQTFKDTHFPSEWLKINCGYRSTSANSKTPKAASGSWHTQGGAIDFTISGNSAKTKEIYKKYFWGMFQGGHGCAFDNGYYIHVDIGSRKPVYKYPV